MRYYASFPPPDLDKNPFMILLADALEIHGWKIKAFTFKFRNLLRFRKSVSILYFHWPESIWRSDAKFITVVKQLIFILRIKASKLLGYRIVWSAHNVLPHACSFERGEVFMRRFLLKNCDLVVGHALNTESELEERFPGIRFPYVQVLHGHYGDVYLPGGELKLETLGIQSTSKVFLLLAKDKSYHQEEFVIEAWQKQRMKGCVLLISGKLSAKTANMIKGDQSIIFLEGFKTRPQLGDLFQLSEAVLLPYRRITTSGMFFLAITFGKPVIAPDLTFFNLHVHKDGGALYEQHSQESLRKAIEKIAAGEYNSSAIFGQKARYNWTAGTERLVERFNSLVC